MTMRWVTVVDADNKDEYLVNVEQISVIHLQSNTIIVNGNSGAGNGVYHITKDSIIHSMQVIAVSNER